MDNAEKTICINAEEVPAVKPHRSMPVRKALLMESPEVKQPPECRVQAKCAAMKAPSAHESAPEVKNDVVIKKEKVESIKECEVSML